MKQMQSKQAAKQALHFQYVIGMAHLFSASAALVPGIFTYSSRILELPNKSKYILFSAKVPDASTQLFTR